MRHLRAPGTALLIATAFCCSGHPPAPPSGPEAACFETPAWRILGELSARTTGGGGDTLLLKLVPDKLALEQRRKVGGPPSAGEDPNAIYRYKPGARALEVTDQGEWDRADGPIVGHLEQVGFTGRIPFKFGGPSDYSLRFKDRVLPIAGKGVEFVGASPKLDVAAVLSSEVAPTNDMLFGGGVGSGQRYNQFFRVQDGIEIGQATRVPVNVEKVQISGAWSGDGRYLAYFDISQSRLCVIPGPP